MFLISPASSAINYVTRSSAKCKFQTKTIVKPTSWRATAWNILISAPSAHVASLAFDEPSRYTEEKWELNVEWQSSFYLLPLHVTLLLRVSFLTISTFFSSFCNSTPLWKHEPFVESLGAWKHDWQALSVLVIAPRTSGENEQFISTFSNPLESSSRRGKTSMELIAPTDNDD